MSVVKIRRALEAAAAEITPTIKTVYENKTFNPTTIAASTPYQLVSVAFAQPLNNEFGPVHQERGFLQINLVYPADKSADPATERAELIRNTFPRGTTLINDGQTVTLNLTPQILPGFNDATGRYVLPVRVPFFAQVIS